MLSQSPLEFLATLDKVVAANNVDLEETDRLRLHGTSEEIVRHVLSTYIDLRALGYSNTDLSGYLGR